MLASSCSETAYVHVQQQWGLTPVTAYGLTESGTVAFTTFGEPGPSGTSGTAVSEFELRLVDADEGEVPPGHVGEAILRKREPWIAPHGYFRMPEETISSRRILWFHTKDLLRVDEKGWYYFAGRVNDSMRW